MLYLVATPIGNLGDMTFRAVEVLRSVDLIASEDTRKTSILLRRYEITKPQVALNVVNEKKVTPKLIAMLIEGKNIALVTSAGTPGISDPGYLLLHEAIRNDLSATIIPGPTAAIMALLLSDLPPHSFTFRGFPPHKEGPRKRFLQVDADSPHTLIFYESPYRLQTFLQNALEVFGDRRIAIANDLTKKFETVYRGSISEMIEKFKDEKIRGEYCVVIAGNRDGLD